MTDPTRQKWDARYAGNAADPGPPSRVLTEYAHLLPSAGTALDLACGLGANGLFLARHGLTATAWDISGEAIARLRGAAAGLAVKAEVRDVVAAPPPPDAFDVVVVGRFLERSLCPAIAATLRPGGLLFYQTFSRRRVGDHGPRNPAYRLEDNELLRLFSRLKVRAYHDEATVGDTTRGFRDEAMLVAQRES